MLHQKQVLTTVTTMMMSVNRRMKDDVITEI